MIERSREGTRQTVKCILTEVGLPALAFTVGVGLATGEWLASALTGLAMGGAISCLYRLERRFLSPRLERVSPDWLRLGLDMTLLLFDHVAGAVVALLLCRRLFGFAVVPRQLQVYSRDGRAVDAHAVWGRRHCTKFNGVSYVTQAAAAAVYTQQGREQCRRTIDIYMNNASLIRKSPKTTRYLPSSSFHRISTLSPSVAVTVVP